MAPTAKNHDRKKAAGRLIGLAVAQQDAESDSNRLDQSIPDQGKTDGSKQAGDK